MATPPIMPVGFVRERTTEGVVLTLAQPGETHSLKTGDHVTVWSHIPEKNATARVLGIVTDVDDTIGTFTIMRTETEGPWPDDADPLGSDSPVYRAIKGTHQPDPDS